MGKIMNESSEDFRHFPKGYPAGLLVIAGLITVFSVLGSHRPAFADAGGFPTNTPTITPTPTPIATNTNVPSTPPVTSLPSPTLTPIPSITLVNLMDVQDTPGPAVNLAAGTSQQQPGISLFSCWPLIVIFLLVGIVIAAYLLTRRAKLEAEDVR
jgi:hypothetical protein